MLLSPSTSNRQTLYGTPLLLSPSLNPKNGENCCFDTKCNAEDALALSGLPFEGTFSVEHVDKQSFPSAVMFTPQAYFKKASRETKASL